MKHSKLKAFFTQDYGRIVSTLVRRFGLHLITDAEDAVQYAILQATETLQDENLPYNTSAWLYTQATSRRLLQSYHSAFSTRRT